MYSRRRENSVITFGEFDRTLQRSTMRISRADIQNGADARIVRTLNHLITIGSNLGPSMCACESTNIYRKRKVLNCRPTQANSLRYYLSLAPFGTSSVNVAITGRPCSPMDAATTMPC